MVNPASVHRLSAWSKLSNRQGNLVLMNKKNYKNNIYRNEFIKPSIKVDLSYIIYGIAPRTGNGRGCSHKHQNIPLFICGMYTIITIPSISLHIQYKLGPIFSTRHFGNTFTQRYGLIFNSECAFKNQPLCVLMSFNISNAIWFDGQIMRKFLNLWLLPFLTKTIHSG